MTKNAIIDARTRRQPLDALLLNPEDARTNARADGELWTVHFAVKTLHQYPKAPLGVFATFAKSPDDKTSAKWLEAFQSQHSPMLYKLAFFDVIGNANEVAHRAFGLARSFTTDEIAVGEIIIRQIDLMV